jgi:hypothetical protein
MSESDFRAAYGKLVAATWSNEELIGELKAHPHKVLNSFGIETRSDADVRVVEMKPTGKGSFEEQWEDWKEGESTGTYDLWLPAPPSDAKGTVLSDVATTCTPCCTCT